MSGKALHVRDARKAIVSTGSIKDATVAAGRLLALTLRLISTCRECVPPHMVIYSHLGWNRWGYVITYL